MKRSGLCAAVVIGCAWAGAAVAGVKYTTNGPNVLVPIVDRTTQPIAPWVQADPELDGNVRVDDVHDYNWTFFPAAAGRIQLRTVRSSKTGKIALELGIKPTANSPNVPTELALFYLKKLDFDIGRKYGGENVAPITHVRSEQNQTTKLYHLVFTFNTPLPKDRMTWFIIKTTATATEPGAMVTFIDNENLPEYPKYPFVRGAY